MKNFNLTQMLQGCSKRNGMTVRASMHDDGQNCNVKQRAELMSKDEKWSENGALSPTCLRSASDALSFRSRYLRYAAVIFCVLMIGIGNAWGAATYVYLNGDFSVGGWNSYNSNDQFTAVYNSTDGKFYQDVYANGTTQYFRLWTNNHCGPTTNNTEMKVGDGGAQANSYEEHNWMYKGKAGILRVCIDQTSSKDWNPWVWLERPTVYIRHKWNNSSTSNQAMTDNKDGTYKYKGQYSSSSSTTYVGTCSSCSSGGDMFKQFSSPSTTGSPTNGDWCLFEYNASSYRGKGGQSSNKGTLTITRLYSITYDGNGKTSGSVPSGVTDAKWNVTQTVAAKGTLAKTGYVFVGWNTAANGSGTDYAPGATFSPSAVSTTLYAQWVAIHETSKYTTAAGSGGYGKSYTNYSSRDYEWYGIYKNSSNNKILPSATGSDVLTVGTFVNNTGSISDWIGAKFSGNGSNTTSSAISEFPTCNHHVLLATTTNVLTLVVKGYDQFGILAQDASGTKGNNQYLRVYIDGDEETADAEITNSITARHYDLDDNGTAHIIRITGNSSGGGKIWAFSLRLPPSSCTAPSALAAASPTAKGITLSVTDANDVNNYEFYVSTESTAPEAGATATHSVSSAKSLTITNLVAGTTYYAWARTKCSASNKSDWVSGGNFTTSTVSVTHTLTNVTHTSGATSGIGGSNYTAVFTANTGYSMPNPTVTIGGNAATIVTDYTWSVDGSVGTITIPANKINGNIAITLNSVPSAPSSAVISGTYHYFPGDNISLTCTPSGNNGPTTYQWYKGGTADGNRIAGATSATYTKNSCTFDDAGSYYCQVTCNATSIWANTNSSENYDVKILRLYVNGSKGGKAYGNVDFVKVNSTTATASISLGSNWTYGFNIADGCGHYYGNNGTMQYNSCTNWTTNVDGKDCGLTTTNAATYTFTINYSNLGAIVTSVTFPVANQAEGKVIYFDNNVLKWTGSSIYYRIGHSSHSQADQLSLVPGTANLYKMTTREYNGFFAWQIGNAEGGNGSSKSIYNTKNTPAITASIAYEGGAVTADAVTVTPGVDHSKGGDAQNNNCEFYSKTITSGMKTDRVTISPYSNGTITVNYTNTSGSAATLTSGNADLAHTVILTSITAVPAEGYDASAITINGGAYSTNYVVTGNTTIAASFTLKTYTISYNKGTNGTGSKVSETKTHGVNFTLPGSTFTYGGHAQDGWSTSDGGALAYALSGSYTTNAAQEFFPHWKCNTPSITDNGDNTVSITVPSGTTVRYTTDGTDPSSSTGTVYSTTFSIAADCTVKAIAYQSNCTDSEIASQACNYTAPANFQMIANSSAGSEQTLSSGESITQGSKNCATLTGGTAVYTGPGMKVQKGSPYGWYFGSNSDVITITLTGHILQVGSVIAIDGNCGSSNNGIKINTNGIVKTGESSGGEFSGTYTVKAGDTDLIGTNVLTLTRSTGSATRMYSITLSNCQAASPCTTPTLLSLSNQAGCSYSAWNATPSNASTISAAGESISYSWKKGATEKATTASYTPDANGTDYTVTVTVSKAGKISTSVTSSALSATKYAATSISTQPTTSVDAIEGENFTLGTGMVAVGQGTKTYQWYSYTSSGGAGEASIGSATSATYTTSKASAGTYYYKVKVTADCGTATSNMITVTVSEPPCFVFSCSSQSDKIGAISSGGSITASLWDDATLTGGTMTNSSSESLNVNKTYGLVIESGKEVTVTLAAGSSLEVGSVITLSAGVSDASGSQTSGLTVSGNTCSPASKTSSTAGDPFTQRYTVTALDGLAGTNTFTVEMKSDLTKTYLNGITVTGCADCTPINPTLTAGTTTLYSYPAPTSTTLTLDKDGSTGDVTWTSSDASIASVSGDGTSATVTAVGIGSATITASIAADDTYSYCAKSVSKTFTVTGGCGYNVIASAVLTSKTAATTSGCTLLASNMSNSSAPYKLDKTLPSYFGLQLSSGSFQVGDSIIFKVKIGDMDINEGTTYPVAVFTSTSTDDKATAIYTSGANTKGSDNVYIRFVVTSGMLTALNTNKQVLILRNTNIKQNHSMYSVQVKRHLCPEGVYEFTDATGDGKWSTAGNWVDDEGVAESLPTISDRVIISKPVTVDDDDAVASEVILDQKSPNTGKLTIDAGNALIIAGTLKKTTTGTSVVATAAADVIINSTRAAGVGALIIGGETGTNKATVNFATKAKNDGGWVNQFIGSPFSDNEPYVDYAIQLYKFVPRANGDRGWWSTVHEGDEMEEFWGYNVLYNDASELDVTWTGTLNASESKTISGLYYNGSSETDNMFANSWTAPIHVGAIEDADLSNASKTLYMFNAGTPAQEEGQNGSNAANNNSDPGTYISIPIHSAPYAGIGVIPSMQAFYVEATSSDASITLDYNKIVYTPALTSVGIVPNRVPKHNAEVVEPEVIKLHVQSETGWGANTYVLGRADFSEGYEDGWDGAYIEGESATPKLYTPSIDGNMFINCLPEIEGTVVGFRKGSSDNNYIFSFDYDGDEVWYLNDQKAQKSTQIMNGQTYAFVSEAGDNAARFVISATPINKIATGCESVGAEAAKVRKLIINDKVYIIRGGQVFDVLGKTIKK